MVAAWYYNDDGEDQRLTHQFTPNQEVSIEELAALGVDYWNVKGEEDPQLKELREKYNYSYHDYITISRETLPDYENRIKTFFIEHIHDDDEIRFGLDGGGYFDIRGKDDRWIRIEFGKDDMISIPAGIYHRFTLNENNYAKGKI